jgi:hypothetical protein
MVVVVMEMVSALDVPAARNDENVPVGANDTDVGTVEARENRSGYDLFDSPERGMTAAEIKDTIKHPKKLIQLMGAKHHRNPPLATETTNKIDHILLVVRVQTDQRLIEQEQLR